MSELAIQVEARKVRQNIENHRQQQMMQQQYAEQQKQHQERNRKLAMQQRLQKQLSGMNDVSGYKMRDADKQEIYQQVTSGKFMDTLFGDGNGGLDYGKVADVYFKVNNFDKITNFHKQRSANETKQNIINEMSNVSPQGRQTHSPTGSEQDGLDSYMNEIKNRYK